MIESFLGQYGYVALASILIGAGFGIPIPEDVPLLLVGYFSAPSQGVMNFWVTLFVALFFLIGADFLFFYIGHRFYKKGGGELPQFIRRRLRPERQEQIDRYFQRFGARTIFLGRFLPGLRTPIFLCAGLWGVPPGRFLFADGLGALISVSTMVSLGYFFGDHMEEVKAILGQVEYLIAGAILLSALGFYLLHRWRARRALVLSVNSPQKGGHPVGSGDLPGDAF